MCDNFSQCFNTSLGYIAFTQCIRPTWPFAADGVAWSVCLSVCLLVIFVSPAKITEPIKMQFLGADSGRRKKASVRWRLIFGVVQPTEKQRGHRQTSWLNDHKR